MLLSAKRTVNAGASLLARAGLSRKNFAWRQVHTHFCVLDREG